MQKVRRVIELQDYELITKLKSNPELRKKIEELSQSFNTISEDEILIQALNIPDAEENIEDTFLDFTGYRNRLVGIINDLHVPLHNKLAVETALAHLKRDNIDLLIINGDLIDLNSISTHPKGLKQTSFKDEIERTKLMLRAIRTLFPHIRIVYKSGNHEEKRLNKYLLSMAKELADLKELELPTLLGLKDLNIDFVREYQVMNFGEIYGLHGHEVNANGQNPAMSLLNKWGKSFFAGHLHRTNSAMKRLLDGSYIKGYFVGALCNLNPDYAKINAWNLGFAEMKINQNLSFSFMNYQLTKNDKGKYEVEISDLL